MNFLSRIKNSFGSLVSRLNKKTTETLSTFQDDAAVLNEQVLLEEKMTASHPKRKCYKSKDSVRKARKAQKLARRISRQKA